MGMTANFISPGGKILISFGLVASALCGCEAAPYMAPGAAVEVADAADVTDAAMPGADGGDDTLGISDTTVNEGGSAADAVDGPNHDGGSGDVSADPDPGEGGTRIDVGVHDATDTPSDVSTDRPVDGAFHGGPKTSGGTRIRPRYLALDDGSKILFDLFDRETNTTCWRLRDANGVYRCVPYSVLSSARHYSDPSCTTLADIIPVDANCAAPTHASVNGEYRAIGAPVSPRPLYFHNGIECVGVASQTGLHAIGPVLPLTSFVAFEDVREPLTAGVEAIVKVGTDGSRYWRGDMFDVTHGVPAELRAMSSNTLADARVLPIANAERIDGCCSLAPSAPCPIVNEGTICPVLPVRLSAGEPFVTDAKTSEVFAIGPAFVEAYCGTGSPPMCGSMTVMRATRWTVGPALPEEDFVGAQRVAVGTRRYTSTTYVGEAVQFPTIATDSPLYSDSSFLSRRDIIDTGAVTPYNRCRPLKLDDGRYHCLAGVQPIVFIDAACTHPAMPDDADYAYTYEQPNKDIDSSCAFDSPYKLYLPGALIGSGEIQTYRRNYPNTSCREGWSARVRELGSVLDPSTVPALNVVED